MQNFSLRRLLEQPSQLSQAVRLGRGRQASPLGPGIPDDVDYLLTDGRVRLPAHGRALEDLIRALEAAVPPPVPSHLRDSAWSSLLASPGFCFEMRPPAHADPWGVPPASSGADITRIGLVSVAEPGGDDAPVGSVSERIAVVGVLTLQPSHGGGAPDHVASPGAAWLAAHWVTGTSALIDHLCLVHPFAASDYLRRSKKVTLLLAPSARADFAGLDLASEEMRAAHLDLELDVVDRDTLDRRSVHRHIEGRSGSALIVVGPSDHDARELERSFIQSGRGKSATWIVPGSGRSLSDELADRLLSVAGLDLALRPLAPPMVPPSPPRAKRPPMPVNDPEQCLHHQRTSRVYVKDGDDGLWWTRDDAGHGGCVFKTYREHDGVMVHVAEHDEDGTIIAKHKGPTARTMALTNFYTCRKPPSSHLK